MNRPEDYTIVVENEGELSDYAVNMFAKWALEIRRKQGLCDKEGEKKCVKQSA